MKPQKILTCIGIALLVGLFFFAQGKLITGLPEVNEAGEIIGSYTGSLLPPLLVGLGAAAAMWLTGLRGRERRLAQDDAAVGSPRLSANSGALKAYRLAGRSCCLRCFTCQEGALWSY